MAEDTEKRFQCIMDKLFHSHKSSLSFLSSASSAEKTKGQKRPFSAIESNSKGDKGEFQNGDRAPPCRPWDREDLMRRLATFKSMRWFAKPKVVDAVNCAMRGWVNIDMDIIGCENCGARLQFSTPSAWNQQQVEKAALVFSLKLDSGHKALCPWINNACDENLALFPPMPTPILVDQYKERSSLLLKLSALPVISTSVIESIKNLQLQHFLKQSITMECGSAPNESSWTEYLRNDVEAVCSDLYYQSLRLLSLFGWEPRSLPYMVDCEDKLSADEPSNRLSVYMYGSNERTTENEDLGESHVYYDPSSTVLDCKLCGASIGLWAFTTVPPPLELVRVVGYTELGGGSDANKGKKDLGPAIEEGTSSKSTMLNLTIAGGPPPTKQSFRAKISLPVIGRIVRTRLSSLSSDLSSNVEDNTSLDTVTDNSTKDMQSDGVSDNGTQESAPSIAVYDSMNSQEMYLDNTGSREETLSLSASEDNVNGVGDATKSSLQKDDSNLSIDKDITKHSSNRKMEFDVIRQHRHFCPWVASMEDRIPGWQQTLSALQKEKVFSVPELEGSPSSPSLIKVDDPITSIRRLFESPAKKQKPSFT